MDPTMTIQQMFAGHGAMAIAPTALGMTLEQARARWGGAPSAAAATNASAPMSVTAAVATLRRLASGTGAEAVRARRMLAAVSPAAANDGPRRTASPAPARNASPHRSAPVTSTRAANDTAPMTQTIADLGTFAREGSEVATNALVAIASKPSTHAPLALAELRRVRDHAQRAASLAALDARMGLAPAANAVPELLRKTQITPTKGSPPREHIDEESRAALGRKMEAVLVERGLETRRDERNATLRPELRGHGTLTGEQARRELARRVR